MVKQSETSCVVVSRHNAAVALIAHHLSAESRRGGGDGMEFVVDGDSVVAQWCQDGEDHECRIPVLRGNVAVDDVREKHVYGNIPLHLAAAASVVSAVEFDGAPPRGQEYGLDEMLKAGARVTDYVIQRTEDHFADHVEHHRAGRLNGEAAVAGDLSDEQLLAELARRMAR